MAYPDGLSGLSGNLPIRAPGFRDVLAILAYPAYPGVISGLSGLSGPYPDFFRVAFFAVQYSSRFRSDFCVMATSDKKQWFFIKGQHHPKSVFNLGPKVGPGLNKKPDFH